MYGCKFNRWNRFKLIEECSVDGEEKEVNLECDTNYMNCPKYLEAQAKEVEDGYKTGKTITA